MSNTTKALDELINKWVKKDHPEKMPGLEVCIYEASLINGLDWAAEEGAETLTQLRAENDQTKAAYQLAVHEATVATGERNQLRADLEQAKKNDQAYWVAQNIMTSQLLEQNKTLARLRTELEAKELRCSSCRTILSAQDGYWYCTNNNCGQTPEDDGLGTHPEVER